MIAPSDSTHPRGASHQQENGETLFLLNQVFLRTALLL